MNARLFLALWPDAAVRSQLAAWRACWRWPKSATPVRSDRLHVTLHFIGDVPEDRIAEIADALEAPFTSFELAFGCARLWPHGVAVLEPLQAPDALAALHAALRSRLLELQPPVDARSFKPHVTLARRAGAAAQHSPGPDFVWQVRGYSLMRSHLGEGAAYEVVRQYSS